MYLPFESPKGVGFFHPWPPLALKDRPQDGGLAVPPAPRRLVVLLLLLLLLLLLFAFGIIFTFGAAELDREEEEEEEESTVGTGTFLMGAAPPNVAVGTNAPALLNLFAVVEVLVVAVVFWLLFL